jgi:hypothetical protein
MNNNAIKCLGDNGVCIPLKTYSYEKKTTNADKIRAMSDEELAEYLVNFKNKFGEEYEGKMSCLDWLQSEAE